MAVQRTSALLQFPTKLETKEVFMLTLNAPKKSMNVPLCEHFGQIQFYHIIHRYIFQVLGGLVLITGCQNLQIGISLTAVVWSMDRVGGVQKIRGKGSGTHGKTSEHNTVVWSLGSKEASRIQEASGNWSAR